MSEALPLADQPQLLQPNARREDLFGIPKQPIVLQSSTYRKCLNPVNKKIENFQIQVRAIH